MGRDGKEQYKQWTHPNADLNNEIFFSQDFRGIQHIPSFLSHQVDLDRTTIFFHFQLTCSYQELQKFPTNLKSDS